MLRTGRWETAWPVSRTATGDEMMEGHNMSTREHFDGVLIAGAGPVGLTAALRLAQAGVPVRIYEAADALNREARASTFHAPTLEMLDMLGLADELVGRGLVAPTYQFRDREFGCVVELDMRVLEQDTRFPFRLQLNQGVLADLIHERLAHMDGVEVLFDTKVTSVTLEGEHAVVLGVVGPDGRPRNVSAPYLIGADGSRSAVRSALDIDFEGVTYPDRYLVAATSMDLMQHIPDLAYVNYVGDPDQWYVLLATPDGWRVLFPVPLDVPDEEVAAEDRVQDLLKDVIDLNGPWPLLYKQLYKVHQRLASTFRVGRVCLAGDAAHINNPLGGMGMNSGIHDAYELSGRLVTLFHEGHDEASLEAYGERRRRIAGEYVNRDTDKNWSQLREKDPEVRARQHARWRELKDSPERERAFLLRSSMLESVRAFALSDSGL